jgi:hypothetical protein
MAVSPNYFITGVWFQDNDRAKRITHVFLHRNTADGFEPGVKAPEEDVIKLLGENQTVMTLRWDYSKRSWFRGASVGPVPFAGRVVLRTHKDAQIEDNLDNMIKMNFFIQGLS